MKKNNKWQARIKDKHLGYFFTPELAAKNYDFHAIKIFGKSAYLNFPDENYSIFTPYISEKIN
jgi:hypothetical protein